MNNVEYGKFHILDKAVSLTGLMHRNSDAISILINFESKSSIKIIPYFNKIKTKERDALINFFAEFGINLLLDDLLGKLHIIILKILLEEKRKLVLVINDTGLTPASINFLVSNFNVFVGMFKNKSIIICPKLINSDNLTI